MDSSQERSLALARAYFSPACFLSEEGCDFSRKTSPLEMQMSLLTVECASTATQEAIKEKRHVQEGEKVIYAAVDKYHKDSLVICMLIL